MKIRVKQPDLAAALAAVHAATERKATIPILMYVLVEATNGAVRLMATDLEVVTSVACPAEVLMGGTIAIPARRLMDYVRLLPDAPVEITVGDNQWATISCGRTKTRISCLPGENFPKPPEMPSALTKIPAVEFSNLVNRTIMAVASNESRFTLNGALLRVKDSALTLAATDSHRMAVGSIAGVDGEYRALLPKKAMGEILKLGAGAAEGAVFEFAGDENHLFFRIGESLLISRKLTGNFPDYERVLPREHPGEIWLRREEFRRAIERVAQFSDERSRAIRVRVQAGGLKVFSSVAETGESEETLPIDYTGPTAEFGFNATYLLEFLKVVPTGDVKFLFKDGNSAGEFRPDSGDGYRYVVMPMRI